LRRYFWRFRPAQFSAESGGFFVTGQKFLAVGREIADGRVELKQADDHF
jgi:hypothetical protein